MSPTSGTANQSHLQRHCSGSQQQQSNFISRPNSCGNHQQNNISLQQTGIPKVHQLEVYSNIENQNNPSVTSSLQGGCSTSSIGLSSSNENAQSNTSRSCGKYFQGEHLYEILYFPILFFYLKCIGISVRQSLF